MEKHRLLGSDQQSQQSNVRIVLSLLAVACFALVSAYVLVNNMESHDNYYSELYDSLDDRKGRSFPQNEQAWLEMAANFKTPLFAKTDSEVKELNEVRKKAQAWVETEKKQAYAKAKKLAVTENYVKYDKYKGIATHKDTGKATK